MTQKEDYTGPVNAGNAVLEVYHSELKRYSDSPYKSKCPVCKKGVLLVHRDQKTYELLENDHCVFCGQHFKYLDIDKLNKVELVNAN